MPVKGYNETKNRLSKIEGIGRQGAEDALKKAALSDPQLFEGILTVPQVKAFKKKLSGSSKISLEAVQLLLRKGGLERTQKAISDELALKYPQHGISSRIWQRDLPPYEWKAIQVRVRGDLGENSDVRGCKTLADVRKKLIAIQQDKMGNKAFNVKVIISNDKVRVGNALYSIEEKLAGEYKYKVIRLIVDGKRQSMRVDAIEAFLSQ